MNAPEKIPSVRDQLRAATDDIHQFLHRAAPFAAIADGTATVESYGRTLQFLHHFHSMLSPLCGQGAQGLGLPELASAPTRRVTALENDLACLGMMASSPERAVLNVEEAFCAGALYTVQGSTLGGKLIYRQLETLLPSEFGRSFFKGVPDDARNWQALCMALEKRPDDLAGMKAGALYAFGCFRDMLE